MCHEFVDILSQAFRFLASDEIYGYGKHVASNRDNDLFDFIEKVKEA
jgi:hypothetical protein